MAGHSFYILVNKSKQIVNGVRQDTTVEDIVNWLCSCNNLLGPHSLAEDWNGCTRLLKPNEKLCETFSVWGREGRRVTLKIISDKKLRKLNSGKRRTWVKRKRRAEKKFLHLVTGAAKVACNHYPLGGKQAGFCKAHRKLQKRRLQDLVKESAEVFLDLQDQLREDETEVLTNSRSEADIAYLNPSLQHEYVSLKNAFIKEKQLKKDLQKHKKELEQTINSRQSEILSLEMNVESTQEKIDAENKELDKLPSDIKENQEFKQATRKLESLRNRLKAKQKISQLQSMKMQELLSVKSKHEKLVQDCQEEIRLLRLTMYKDKQEEDREMV